MAETELAEAITAHAAELNRRALERIYHNPFWMERFGERGRRFAEEDGLHHLSYLAEAVRQHDPAVLEAYARWLQSVLTTRGMCSLHIAEHFAELGREIEAQGWPEAETAGSYLSAAQAALRHSVPVAGRIQDEAVGLAAMANAELSHRHPERQAREVDSDEPLSPDDPRYVLSYLSDSIANGRPELFAAYVAWLGGFLERRAVPTSRVAEELDVLDAMLRQSLGGDPGVEEAIRPAFETARAALVEEAG